MSKKLKLSPREAIRYFGRSTPSTTTRTVDPRTCAALREVIARRNAGPGGPGGLGLLGGRLTDERALDALVHVRDKGWCLDLSDFLGGVGLVKIFGLKMTLTSAGYALLADAGRV